MKKTQTKQAVLLIVAASLILLIFFSNSGLPTGEAVSPQPKTVKRFGTVYTSNPTLSGNQMEMIREWPLQFGRFTIDFKKNFASDTIEGMKRCEYYNMVISNHFLPKDGDFCQFKAVSQWKTIGPFVVATMAGEKGFPARTIEVEVIGDIEGQSSTTVGYHVLYKIASSNDWKWGTYCTIAIDREVGGKSTCRVNLPRATDIFSVMAARAAFGPGPTVSVTDIRVIT